jgi:YkoY family integral membrane protein
MIEQIVRTPFETNLTVPFLLLILVVLEAVLSADNAIALASIAQCLEDRASQRRALNIGLIAAYFLRVALILTATWVSKFWQFEVLGAVYLLWLALKYFTAPEDAQHHHHGFRFTSLWQAIPVIAVTDLAFSLDSVTTAIAVADQTWLILVGGTIGVIALRFLAGLFIRWIAEYERLEDAGYIAVAFVGTRLLLKALAPSFVPPEWLMLGAIALAFFWGFSERTPSQSPEQK